MKDVFLVISGIISVASAIPYIVDTLKHKTKPNLVSWSTWALLTGIATAAAISAGEYRAAFFTGLGTLGCTVITLIGIRHGYFKYTTFDMACQIGAVVGIILWQLFDSPEIAIIASVTIDFIGALPTVRHSWIKPYEETWEAYGLAAISAIALLLSLTSYNVVSLSYAVYIVLINTVLVTVILYRRNLITPQRHERAAG